jgi:hypothetical protein
MRIFFPVAGQNSLRSNPERFPGIHDTNEDKPAHAVFIRMYLFLFALQDYAEFCQPAFLCSVVRKLAACSGSKITTYIHEAISEQLRPFG